MKNLFILPILASMVVTLVCGCVTNDLAYKSLAGLGYTVDGAMKAAGDAKASNIITADQWAEIALRHEQYRVSYRAALLVARMDTSAIAPIHLQDLADGVVDVINQFLNPHPPSK